MKLDFFLGQNIGTQQMIGQIPRCARSLNERAQITGETVMVNPLKIPAGLSLLERRLDEVMQAFLAGDNMVEARVGPAVVVQQNNGKFRMLGNSGDEG